MSGTDQSSRRWTGRSSRSGAVTADRPAGPSGSPLVGRGDADRYAAITRSLLGYGVLAGVLYVVSGLVQALTRDGYDLARHDLSLLANGSAGWVQIVTFVVSGLMTVAAAVGMHRAMRTLGGGTGSVWGPRLVAGYGLGLIGAGACVADPMHGFPPGTPDGPPATVTVGGVGHVVCGGLGFLCLVAACVVLARHHARTGRTGLAGLSVATAVLFGAAFAGIATGSASAGVVLGFGVAVVLAWTWLAVISIDLYRRTPLLTPADRPNAPGGAGAG